MSKIAIIGYGNVGYHLANRLERRNQVDIYARNPKESTILPLDSLDADAYDFIILSVPDGAIKEVSESFETSKAVVMHTSGSRSLEDVSNHAKYGVLYPLQTFSRAKEIDFNTFPIFVEGNEVGEAKVYSLASTIGNDVRLFTSANRAKLHLAAVFACNFSNHMFHIAEKLLKEFNMSFKEILPLVEETFQKAVELGPSQSQTGPAVRKDELTINAHLDMLTDEPLKELYQRITDNIQRYQ